MALYTQTSVSIGEEQFKQFHSLHLKQSMTGHHALEIRIGYDWLLKLGKDPVSSGQSFLGKEVRMTVESMEGTGNGTPLSFNGVVTAVTFGKESNSINGHCTVYASSPTILLDGNPHIQSFETQNLANIVNTVLKTSSAFPGSPEVNPEYSAQLKYIVQYKETGFQFLHRLSQRFGEWFFYNGQRIIFGKNTPQKVTLFHQVNLVEYNISLRTVPNNQALKGQEYRNYSDVDFNTNSISPGNLDNYTQTAKNISDKLYNRAFTYKVPHAFSSNAKEELENTGKRQQQAQMAQMVLISGRSKSTALRLGDTISIQENIYSTADHGEFLLTSLEHFCDGNGEYYNLFEGIPAATAVPPMNIENIPYCEAQSAVVVENFDPKGLGRVRVRFNWQNGMTPWVRIIQPHGGGDKGFYFLPETGEEVWVDFEGGNPEAPYITGTLYNGGGKTDYGDTDNNIKAIRTRSGHTIRLDDTAGQEFITINDKGGNTIVMDTNGQNISITALQNIKIQARNINIIAVESVDVTAGTYLSNSAGYDLTASAGMNIMHNAGDSITQYSVNDYKLSATNITKIASENMDVQAKSIEKTAEQVKVDSSKEEMTINSGKSVAIKSAEKSKLF
ncbi:phage baseplate assembly protein V [Chitinophaga sp.]|uniref:type VI secretion system Vgr family protein n=1 Tax=Chitinophaga sp. TaxID=1869181 RepID=UPI0031DE8AD5